MKVSIITACYNAEKTIEETIRSVVKQTYPDIEYIVIDGASKDKTLEIVNKYAGSVAKLVSEPDNGVYNAMNKGINASTGDLLFFLNADDVFINEKVVEIFAKEAETNNAGLLLGNILLLNRYTGEMYYEKHDIIDKIRLINSTIFHPATFFRKEVFKKYGLFNENNRIASDYEWYVNYFLNGGNYAYFNRPVSIFSLGEGLSSDSVHGNIHKTERQDIQRKYFSAKELKTTEFLTQIFPRKINKVKFRKFLAKSGINKIYYPLTTHKNSSCLQS